MILSDSIAPIETMDRGNDRLSLAPRGLATVLGMILRGRRSMRRNTKPCAGRPGQSVEHSSR